MSGRIGAPWWAHVMLYAGGLTMVVAGGAAAMGQYALVKANNTIANEDILGADRAEVDADNIEGPLDFLVLGVDEQGGGKRSDTMMMVHVNADLTDATLISVPRDLWVPIPDCGPNWGDAACEFKLNHASSLDDWGDSLRNVNQTLYDLTGVRFHGAATANFEGFIDLVEVVGEVELCPWHEITSIHTDQVFPEGCAKYDKDEALDLVRQRKGWSWDSDWESGRGGDYGRTLMQQQAIKSILVEAKNQGFHTDPGKAVGLLEGFGDNLTVDLGELRLTDLITAMRDVNPDSFASINVPASSEQIDHMGEPLSIDRIHDGEEREAADALWAALADDTVEEWIAAHPEWVKDEG